MKAVLKVTSVVTICGLSMLALFYVINLILYGEERYADGYAEEYLGDYDYDIARDFETKY
jgi:hypothetical protein